MKYFGRHLKTRNNPLIYFIYHLVNHPWIYMLEEVNILRNSGDMLVGKSYETFPTDTAKHVDMRDVEYDSEIDSNNEGGLEYN